MEQTQPEPKPPKPPTPQAAALVQRMKDLRDKRGWTAERLAQEMRAVGVDWTRGVVTKLETGRRADVTVTELLALARVLQCAPVHLIVPPDADTYPVTKTLSAPAHDVRDWIRGYGFLPDDDRQQYLTEVPRDEFEEIAGVLFPKRQPWQLRQMRREQPSDREDK